MLTKWGSKSGLAKQGCKKRCYFEVLIHLVQIASTCLTGRHLGLAAGNVIQGLSAVAHCRCSCSVCNLQRALGDMYTQGPSPKERQPIFGPSDSHCMDLARLKILIMVRKDVALLSLLDSMHDSKLPAMHRIVLSSHSNDLQLCHKVSRMLMQALSCLRHCYCNDFHIELSGSRTAC